MSTTSSASIASGPALPPASPVAPHEIAAVVRAALRAPSGDNVQPWSITIGADGFDVWFDADRGACFLDVEHCASQMAVGALLETASIAAATSGLRLVVTLQPIGSRPALWARVQLSRMTPSPDPLLGAIAARHTNRNPYDGSPLLVAELDKLVAEARGSGSLFLVTEQHDVRAVADLVGIADAIRASCRAAHDDLHRWLRWTPADVAATCDGLDVRTLGLQAAQRFGLRATRPWSVQRAALALGAGRAHAAYGRALVQSSSAVGLLVTRHDDLASHVAVGRVMQRLWLRATLLGLAFSPAATLPLLLARVRRLGGTSLAHAQHAQLTKADGELRARFGVPADCAPAFLFRVGRAAPMETRSLRRPPSDVVVS